MTLLELLVKELDEWPLVRGAECGFIVQEYDGELFSTHNLPPLFSGACWYRRVGDDLQCGYIPLSEFKDVSSDWQTAIITRSQWESAKLAATK